MGRLVMNCYTGRMVRRVCGALLLFVASGAGADEGVYRSVVHAGKPLLIVIDAGVRSSMAADGLDAWTNQLQKEGWQPRVIEHSDDESLPATDRLHQLKAEIYSYHSFSEPLDGVVLVGRYPQPTGPYGNPTDLWFTTQNEHVHLQSRDHWPRLMTEVPPYYLLKAPDFWLSRIELPSELDKKEQGQWLARSLEGNVDVRTSFTSKDKTPLVLEAGFPSCEGLLICTPANRNYALPTKDGLAAGAALKEAYDRDIEEMNSTTLNDWFTHYKTHCTVPWPEYNPVTINFALLWRTMVLLRGFEPRGSSGGELVILPPEFFIVGGLSVVVTAAEALVAGVLWYQAGLKAKLLSGALTAAALAAMNFVPYKCDPRWKFKSSPLLPVMLGDGTLPVKSLFSRND